MKGITHNDSRLLSLECVRASNNKEFETDVENVSRDIRHSPLYLTLVKVKLSTEHLTVNPIHIRKSFVVAIASGGRTILLLQRKQHKH